VRIFDAKSHYFEHSRALDKELGEINILFPSWVVANHNFSSMKIKALYATGRLIMQHILRIVADMKLQIEQIK
jgi:hypothetical protein